VKLLSYVHLRNIYRSTGAGRVARQMTEQLALVPGVDLRILADAADHRRTVQQVGAPWTGFRYHFFRHETSLQQARWFFLANPRAESFWPEAELIYCTAESYVPTRSARLAVTAHDAAIFETGAHSNNRALYQQRLKWNLLYRTLSRRADLFHTVSQFSADRLAHFFPSIRSRLRVVHNAVSQRFFEPVHETGERFLADHGLRDRPFILLPGGLHFRKNADLVLAAWPLIRSKHPDLVLAIVNHSNPDYAARAGSLGPAVKLLGFVDDDALASLYHAAALVWFPSRYEGFGLPVLEAMACGAPTVASDSSSLPEIAGNAALLLPPDRPDQHAEAIASLLSQPQERAALTRRGLERAAQFTWAASAQKLHGHFAAIL